MSRSAWYWANERLRRWCASSLVYVRIRLAAMLYVGRNADRRWNDVLAGELGDLVETNPRRPEHDGVAEVVDPAAAGAAGQLGVLPRRQPLVVLAGELGQLLDHDRTRRHVDADGQGLGGEHHLHEAR